MADYNKVLAGAIAPGNIAYAQGTANAITTATQAAASANSSLLISKILITADGQPVSAVRALIKHNSTTMFSILIPATNFGAELDFNSHPISLPAGESCVVTVPALGSGVSADVAIFSISSSAS